MDENSNSETISDIAGWDAAAQYYAEWIDGGCGVEGKAFTTIVTDSTLKLIGEVKGKSVLDLGCGEGYLARELSQRGARVAAIDGSPALIAIAESKQSTLLGAIEYRVADITKEFPYPEGSFDLVLCNMTLMDLPDISAPIRESARVLKLDGKLVFSVVHPCFYEALGEWFDSDTPAPAFRFRRRYTEQVHYMKHLRGFPPDVLLSHYNRPISAYVNAVIGGGLSIADFVESSFSREFLESLGLAHKLLHFHLTANNLIIGAVKKS